MTVLLFREYINVDMSVCYRIQIIPNKISLCLALSPKCMFVVCSKPLIMAISVIFIAYILLFRILLYVLELKTYKKYL